METKPTPRTIRLSPMEPYDASINLNETALILIDFQKDFLQPGGFGEMLGNDVSKLQRAVPPCRRVLEAARKANLPLILHTREGHRRDLTDLMAYKFQRPDERPHDSLRSSCVIGTDPGHGSKILVRGEEGHDIIPELYPIEGEPIIDKPGKGSFYATDLQCILISQGIKNLIVCGVTTEVCVHTTIREANDRGYFCIMLEDCCASFFDEFHASSVQMTKAQGGIFGSVATSSTLIKAFDDFV